MRTRPPLAKRQQLNTDALVCTLCGRTLRGSPTPTNPGRTRLGACCSSNLNSGITSAFGHPDWQHEKIEPRIKED